MEKVAKWVSEQGRRFLSFLTWLCDFRYMVPTSIDGSLHLMSSEESLRSGKIVLLYSAS